MSRLKYILLGFTALVGLAANGPQGCDPKLEPPPLNKTLLNPTKSYEDRLRLFHLLKSAHPYPPGWTDHRDGIGLQSHWQVDSGRDLKQADGQLFTWWPNVNWTLVVWPFLVLQTYRGEFPNIQVSQFDGWKKNRFWIPFSIVQAVLAYYDALDKVTKNPQIGITPSDLQRLLWDFHHKAVVLGMERNKDLLPTLEIGSDRGERKFAESWGTMVGILKVVRFPTGPDAVGLFNFQALPSSWVWESDYSLWSSSSNLSYKQRVTLKMLWAIHKFEQKWGQPILKLLTYLSSLPGKISKLLDLIRQAVNEGWGPYSLWKSLWGLA